MLVRFQFLWEHGRGLGEQEGFVREKGEWGKRRDKNETSTFKRRKAGIFQSGPANPICHH